MLILYFRISCFVGLAIEIWKVTKVQDVSFDFENKWLGLVPRVQLEDKKDYEDSGTKEFDKELTNNNDDGNDF